jgi:hypothetical protein
MAKTAVKSYTLKHKGKGIMAITNPVVNKVFNDLDEFRDYATTETDRNGNPLPFNEADLYNDNAWMWKNFKKWKNWKNAKARAKGRR